MTPACNAMDMRAMMPCPHLAPFARLLPLLLICCFVSHGAAVQASNAEDGAVIALTDTQFNTFVREDSCILLTFHAPWCGKSVAIERVSLLKLCAPACQCLHPTAQVSTLPRPRADVGCTSSRTVSQRSSFGQGRHRTWAPAVAACCSLLSFTHLLCHVLLATG